LSVRGAERVKALVRLIEALDACRVGRLGEFSRFERGVRSLRLSGLPFKVKDLRRAVEAIAEIPRRHPGYSTVRRLSRLSSALSMGGVAVSMASLLLIAVLRVDSFVYYATLLALIATFYASYLARWYSDEKVLSIYEERMDELLAKGEPLKRTVEFLMDEIRREARRSKLDLSEVKISLYLPDYRGVEVVKKPGRLRARYVVRLRP